MTSAFIGNLQGFTKTLASARAKIEGKATARYQKFVKQTVRELSRNTPQWSGDLAASWQVIVGKGAIAADPPYTGLKGNYTLGDKAPHFIGDRGAVNLAVRLNADAIKSIRWNSVVRIENNSETLLTGDNEEDFNLGPITEQNLREGNYIPGDIMAVKTVALMHKTSKLTSGMPEDE
jgi:hypothetical protein